MTEFPFKRRDLLRATGAGLLGTAGVGAAQTTGAQETSGGDLVWEFTQPSDYVLSSPTVADGTVYVGSGDSSLYAVDAATGSQEWAFDTSDSVQSSPTVADGTVYVGSDDSNLYAVDAATGSQEWAFTQPSDPVFSSPTVANGTVYVGSDDSNLYAVDAATGSQEWAFTQPSDPVFSSPTVADGTVYVGSNDGNLYAVDAATGDQEWVLIKPLDWVASSPTVADGTVYVGSDDNDLYAVDAATGEWEWTFTQPLFWVRSSPTVADGTVYVGAFDDTLYAVAADSGSQEWAFDIGDSGGFWGSSPTVADGIVYVGYNDSNLYAVDAADGTEQWRFNTGRYVESSPTVADGTVYVGSGDSSLYAVDAGVEGSSEGSRVRLRTLGHHDENIGQPPGGEPSWTLTAQAFQPVDGPGPLPAQPGETFRLSLVITNTGTVPGDASIQFVSASSGEHNADYYGDQFAVESHTDDGGEWFVEGWRWDENTDSGPIAPDETREPVVELAVAEDVSAGEYTFAMSGPGGAMATATVTVAPLDGTRQQKLALAGRIDDAATFDSLLTREPSTLAFQPEQEVARNSLDLLEESVPDGSLSRETAIDAANRLIWGEQLTEDVLQYTGDATITTDVTELPDDLNITQQTAGPLLKVAVSLLLQTQAASKIVSSVSQKLPGAVSINPDQIEGVANKLLDIALGFNSETDDVPADAPDTTDPTTLLEDLQLEVATIVEEIENGVTTSVDAVLSTIDAVVQPFIDVTAGTLRVFLEHIALSGTVTEGIDAGLSGAVTNLHNALRPEAIASGGLAGSQSQAEEAYTEGGAGLIQTAVESADALDGFGTQEKLRDSTEPAVNILKLEPEEINTTDIVEFAIGTITKLPYGSALNVGLGIGAMLNLHASHSNAHTGIINGEG